MVGKGAVVFACLGGVVSGTATTISGSITKSQVSDFTSGTVTSASTAQQAGTAFFASTASTADYATTSGTSVYSANSGTAVTISGTITNSQVSDFTSGTVASASTALTAGTASFASQAATAVYSDTSGTAVTISGSITRSQVSDYASGTVANISGTVTQAQVSGLGSALAGKAGLADNNTFTGTNTFSNFTTFQAASDAIPVRIFGANGQSADLFSVNDYLTNTQFEILSDGRAQSLKGIIATVSGTASIPLVVRGTAGQSADLLQVQNSGGTAVGGFTSAAAFFVNNQTTVANSLNVQRQGSTHFRVDPFNNTFAVGTLTVGQNTTPGSIQLGVFSGGTAVKGLVVRGAASQSANLQEWQTSSGSTATWFNSAGFIRVQGDPGGQVGIVAQNSTSRGIVVRGAASQSVDLIQVQNDTGGTTIRMAMNGQATFGGTAVLGQITAIPASTATVGIVAQALVNQSARMLEIRDDTGATYASITRFGTTSLGGDVMSGGRLMVQAGGSLVGLQVRDGGGGANIQEWQNSGGTARAWVDSTGNFFAPTVAGRNQLVFLREENSGGLLEVKKQTAAAANPGANNLKLYVRDGTNAGTLKLVVRAGTAGAETTILDNIPT